MPTPTAGLKMELHDDEPLSSLTVVRTRRGWNVKANDMGGASFEKLVSDDDVRNEVALLMNRLAEVEL